MGNTCCGRNKIPLYENKSIEIISNTSTVSSKDFEILQPVGEGGFGRVFKVIKKDTCKIYAMKVVRKNSLKTKDDYNGLLTEMASLAELSNPFIMKLYFTFQSQSKLFFITDYINGGSLSFYIQNDLLSEELIILYTAELILALDAIHQKDYLYRDLKPDNILLNEDGHIRLIDFGLCMKMKKRSKWTCGGTPEYLPPEIINHSSFDQTADYWQLGIVVWEMLTKTTPFDAPTTNQIYSNILNKKLEKPSGMSISISFFHFTIIFFS